MKPEWNRKVILSLLALLFAGCDSSESMDRVVGQLESDRVELTAEYAEPITERLVREGDAVTAGQLLLQQDEARIFARIAEASALLRQNQARLDELVRGPRAEQIQAQRANVDGAEQDLEFRQVEFRRALEVYERHLGSTEARDQAKARLDSARANLGVQEARLSELLTGTTIEELRQAENVLQQAEARLSLLEIEKSRHQFVAPIDGIVDSILFETGERPGVGQPAIIMLAGSQPFVRAYIPEAMRVAIVPGTRARVFVDGLENPLDGRVRWVASEAAFTPYFALTERDRGRLTYFAKVDILTERERLPDGVPTEVEFLPAIERD